MRGTPPSIVCEVGHLPMVVESGTARTTVRLGNAMLTLHGTVEERRALVMEMARELGLRIDLPGARELAATISVRTGAVGIDRLIDELRGSQN